MKKRVTIVSTCLSIVLLLIILLSVYNTDNNINNYAESDNAMLAVNLDGERIYEFPSKGMYRVDVDCDNAIGTWDYENWKLSITDLTDDVAYCDIDFVTIETTYLNDYISSLSGTNQGNGKVVDEGSTYMAVGDYSNVTALAKSGYGTTSQYSSSSDSDTSGTSGTFWSFSDGVWTSDASSMSAGTYYHLSTTVQDSGYYQMCYTMSTGHNNNALYVYINGEIQSIGTSNDYAAAYGLITRSECVELGYIESGSEVQFIQYAYSGTFYSVVTMTVDLELAAEKESSVGIRYEGSNPNNYVWYNNELWRIIGVFDEGTHGVSGENLVKIIRANSIGGLTWNSLDTNGWVYSTLKSLLNNYYYYASNGDNSGYCYAYSGTTASATSHCDYTTIGLSSYYRSMVENATWYLGGYSSTDATALDFFGYERSGIYVYSGRSTSTTGKIGLMYASDYGFSVLSSDCDRTTIMSSYNTSSCGGKSWIVNGNGRYTWTITPNSEYDDRVYIIYYDSSLHREYVNYGYTVKPTLYLSSSVYILDGSGTQSDPYIIGMD